MSLKEEQGDGVYIRNTSEVPESNEHDPIQSNDPIEDLVVHEKDDINSVLENDPFKDDVTLSVDQSKAASNGSTKHVSAVKASSALLNAAMPAAVVHTTIHATTTEVNVLLSRCHQLEKTCSRLESQNHMLVQELELVKNENALINTKILSIMSCVAKLSVKQNNSTVVANEASSTTMSSGDQKTMVDHQKIEDEQTAANEKLAAAAALELQLQTITKRITDSDTSLKELTSRVNVTDGKTDWLESELQRYVRRHSIIIENFCPKEDRSASEIFLLFANSVLGVTLDDSDIDSLHLIDRIPGSSSSPAKQGGVDKRPRPVLLTFTCYRARAQVYRAWLAYRTSSTTSSAGGALSGERGQGLCIREFLTELQEAGYKEAVVARDQKRITDCWTFKGKTFVRTLSGEIREFINKEQSIPKEEKSACLVM